MKRCIIAATLAGLMIGASTLGFAAEPDRQPGRATQQRMHDMQGMQGMRGMQGMQGMQGMMNMMHGMMAGQMGSAVPVPQLPPGNEKLQLQMWAEIMQKVGEVVAKYAGQAK